MTEKLGNILSKYYVASLTSSIKNILVTGGAGFIGSHLVERLIADGVDVTVLDNFSTGRTENLASLSANRRLRLVKGDIRDKDTAYDAVKDVKAVFHLAAITSVPFSVEHPKEAFKVNIDGTRSLLEACLRAGVERFVYASSCAVYGEPKYMPIDEVCPLSPVSPYAESKLKAEELCRSFCENYGLETVVLRPFNVYGPRQRNDQYGGVIARFIERLRFGKPPVIYGDGTQSRDFIYVEDAVKAFTLALNNKNAVGGTFNVASGVPTLIDGLANILIELFGAEGLKPEYADARQGDIKHSCADIREAKQHLGFEPRVSLKEGLLTLIGSY